MITTRDPTTVAKGSNTTAPGICPLSLTPRKGKVTRPTKDVVERSNSEHQVLSYLNGREYWSDDKAVRDDVNCRERQDTASHHLVIRKPELDTFWFSCRSRRITGEHRLVRQQSVEPFSHTQASLAQQVIHMNEPLRCPRHYPSLPRRYSLPRFEHRKPRGHKHGMG